ncbi:MAG: hypothetical protein WAO83_24690 [Fuerstiella sp.]
MNDLANQLRIDPFTGRHVIVASGRGSRPVQVVQSVTSQVNYDPFLEGNEHDTPRERLALRKVGSAENAIKWLLRVVPNRYPAVTDLASNAKSGAQRNARECKGNSHSAAVAMPAVNLLRSKLHRQFATGFHEVVVECPDQRTRLSELSTIEVARILFAWQMRLRSLAADPAIRSVNIFRNEGFGAGASLSHCHSQILATDFIPPQLEARLFAEHTHANHSDESLYAVWLNAERADGSRIVNEQRGLVVVCPFASRTAWQARICPTLDRPVPFGELPLTDLMNLAAQLSATIDALAVIAGTVAFNLTLSLPPTHNPTQFPWMLDVLPRPNRFAGFELMTDVEISTTSPEAAAIQYRQVGCWNQSVPPQAEICPAGFQWAPKPARSQPSSEV